MLAYQVRQARALQLGYTLICATFVGLSFLIPRQSALFPGLAVADPAKVVIELMSAMVKLTSTINSAALAFAAGLAIKGRDWSPSWRFVDSIALTTCFIAGAASYFGVYLCYSRLLSMTANGFVNLFELQMIWSIRLQFWGILAEVYLIGLTFCNMVVYRQQS